MSTKVNFHTHTTFCDGDNTAEEIVNKAIELGFVALGFSGHAYTPIDKENSMSLDGTKKYKEEINRLKYKYRDSIKLFCGLEVDYYSEVDLDDFDYVIGSVHYLKKGDKYFPIDRSYEDFSSAVDAFNKDAYALAEEYYKMLVENCIKIDADIVGHFDLISKLNDGDKFFSEENELYKTAAYNAVDALLDRDFIFEVNTGAMARGFKDVPYPSYSLIDRIYSRGGKMILSSDCHNANKLDYGFDEVYNICKIDFATEELLNRITNKIR